MRRTADGIPVSRYGSVNFVLKGEKMLRGCTFNNKQVTDQCDAGLYSAVFKKDGILWGCAMSVKNNNLVIQTGEMIISGRVIWIDGVTTIPFENPIENGYGRAVLTIDLSKAATKKDFEQLEVSVQYNASASSFPALTQGKINQSLGDMVYQIVIATVSISGANVTGITHMIGAAEADADTLNGKTRLEMLKTIYPVGCIYMTASSENPSKTFGFGTWAQWGAGRVPVGIDAQDADFNAAEKAGGAKNITLTAAQSGIQNHRHTFTGKAVTSGTQSANHTHTISGGSHNHAEHYNTWVNAKGKNYVVSNTTGSGVYLNTVSTGREQIYTYDASISLTCGNNSANHTHSVTAAGTISDTTANATAAHSNLQPYITCYMWKRTV